MFESVWKFWFVFGEFIKFIFIFFFVVYGGFFFYVVDIYIIVIFEGVYGMGKFFLEFFVNEYIWWGFVDGWIFWLFIIVVWFGVFFVVILVFIFGIIWEFFYGVEVICFVGDFLESKEFELVVWVVFFEIIIKNFVIVKYVFVEKFLLYIRV